jgi:hypothetical protein
MGRGQRQRTEGQRDRGTEGQRDRGAEGQRDRGTSVKGECKKKTPRIFDALCVRRDSVAIGLPRDWVNTVD